jgi:hypothetical protein
VLQGYFSDYFDGGHFVSLTIDPSNLKGSAEQEFKTKLGLSSSRQYPDRIQAFRWCDAQGAAVADSA